MAKQKWGRRSSDNQAYPKAPGDSSELPQTMFDEARYQKYSDIVKMDTPANARNSVDTLLEEFFSARTRKKRLRVSRVTNLAAQRAGAQLKRKNLSSKERREFGTIRALYNKGYKEMRAGLE